MKKTLAIVLALCMVFALLAGCGGGETGTTESTAPEGGGTASGDGENVIKIGVFEPATGDSASGGKKEMLGMQYANSITPTVDVNGVTYTVQLVPADNGSDNSKAPGAASQLVNEGVSVVLGSYGSGVSMAGGPIFAEANIPAIGVTCTNPNVTIGNDNYFRICFVDSFQGSVLANFAIDEFGAQKAYLLGEQGNEYDQGLMAFFEKVFTEAGGTVIKDSYPKNNADFNTYLSKAMDEQVDVIVTPVSIAYATQIISQASNLGMDIPILGSDTLDDNKVLEAATGTDIELYVSTFYQEGGNEEFDQGIKDYINTNSEALTANGGDDTISAVTAMGYDAYYVALEAIKAAGSTDSGAIMEALWDVVYDGVSGHIEFDDVNGDAMRDTAYIKTVNTGDGVWELVTVQTADAQ